jgi:hypothetical protein
LKVVLLFVKYHEMVHLISGESIALTVRITANKLM